MLMPHMMPAQNVPAIKQVKVRPVSSTVEDVPQCVWTDGMMHLHTEESWPAHAVPLFVFCGPDRPRPAYREEIKFTLKDEKYVNFALRMRCGGGDRFAGGTIGLIHNPECQEALPGEEGQLVTITSLTVLPNNTVIVICIGDLPFRIRRVWMPRGLRGLQMAIVDVEPAAPCLDPILPTCDSEKPLRRFVRLLRAAAPQVAAMLEDMSGKFTVFCPTTRTLDMAFGSAADEDFAGREDVQALLACHVVQQRVPCEALYTGRALTALDGTPLIVTFGKWPRGDPCVNGLPIEHLDIMCANGVIHTVSGLLTPSPGPTRRR